jgi:hypothetical protein
MTTHLIRTQVKTRDEKLTHRLEASRVANERLWGSQIIRTRVMRWYRAVKARKRARALYMEEKRKDREETGRTRPMK